MSSSTPGHLRRRKARAGMTATRPSYQRNRAGAAKLRAIMFAAAGNFSARMSATSRTGETYVSRNCPALVGRTGCKHLARRVGGEFSCHIERR